MLSINGRGKPVRGMIDDLNGILQVFCFDHRNHWPKNLLLGDPHLRGHLTEDGGLDEIPFGTIALLIDFPTQDELRPLFLSDLDIFKDLIKLGLIDHRTNVCLFMKTISQFETGCSSFEFLNEFLVNFLMHNNSTGGSASLATRSKTTPDGPFHSQIEVCIIHYDNRILSTHLRHNDPLDGPTNCFKTFPRIKRT